VGEQVKKTHDLQFLCKLAAQSNEKLNSIEDDCIELTDYSVEIRYPFHFDIEDTDVERALKSTKKIKELILSIVDYA